MNKTKVLSELKRIESMLKDDKEDKSLEMEILHTLPFEIGVEYFVRTVTYHLTGRLIRIVGKFLVFEDCAWIADSGRFNEFFKTPASTLEVEPFGDRDVFVNSDSITDATERKVIVEVK